MDQPSTLPAMLPTSPHLTLENLARLLDLLHAERSALLPLGLWLARSTPPAAVLLAQLEQCLADCRAAWKTDVYWSAWRTCQQLDDLLATSSWEHPDELAEAGDELSLVDLRALHAAAVARSQRASGEELVRLIELLGRLERLVDEASASARGDVWPATDPGLPEA